MTLHDPRAQRLIVLAAVAGLALRLAFSFGYWVGQPLTHDEHEYLSLARGIADGRGFVYDSAVDTGTAAKFDRAPGYPLFLAALDAGRPVPTSTPARVKIAQSLVSAATVALIGLLALSVGGARAGIAAAFLAAIYPSLVFIPAYALSETLFCLLALGTALVLQAAADRASQPSDARGVLVRGAIAGVLAGMAALVRPAMLFFLPLAVVWLLYRRRPALAAIVILGAAMAIAPWTLRNARVHGRFVAIASEGGVTFWTGNHPLAKGEGDLAANPELKRAELAFRSAQPASTAAELEPLYYRDALRSIAGDPVRWAGLLARKAFYTVVPIGPSYALHSTRYRVASTLPYVVVLPFAVAGAWTLSRRRRAPAALYLLAGSSILVCLVFFPQERFRIPVIDPVLIVSAAALAGRPQS